MKYVVMNGMSHYLIIHRNTSESYVGSFCLVMWQDQIMLKIITVLHVKLGQVGPYLPEVQVPGTGAKYQPTIVICMVIKNDTKYLVSSVNFEFLATEGQCM